MVHIDTDTTTLPDEVRLLVQGQLDCTAVGVFHEALKRATRQRRAVEIHLDGVDFIDGCGLSMLIHATDRARHAGHELTIVDPSRSVRRLIEMTDTVDRLPPLVSSARRRPARADGGVVEEALAAGHAPAFRI